MYNKIIYKIKRKWNQNPKFGHKQGEIQKLGEKKNPPFSFILGETRKTINFCDKLSFTRFSFFQSVTTIATYIFIALTYTTTLITFEPCALNVDLIKIHYFMDIIKKWFKGERRPKDKVTL